MYTAAELYGAQYSAPAGAGVAAPTQGMGTADVRNGVAGLLDPHNPLVWFGGVLLVTVGAAGLAGSVRLGKGAASVNIGKA